MRARRLSLLVIVTVLIVSLGCGGNSGGGPPPPPPATYTISGSVSGLAGPLLLQNNGADTITLFADSTFSFLKPVNSGGAYDVTVFLEPQGPVQFCVVSSGSGTATANVSKVQVNCSTPTEQTLLNFGLDANDNNPLGVLVFDNSGNLYGTTSGGSYGKGTVFRLAPSNGPWTETILYNFCQLLSCTDGNRPEAGLIWDAAGNLYGTASSGGAYGGGTVFELTPAGNGTWNYLLLHSFGNGTDGSGTASGLTFDLSGNLYGTTGGGGDSQGCVGGCGTVFELSPGSGGSWTENVIYSFCSASDAFCPDGALPMGGVVLDAAGNLYGTTYQGGGDLQDGVVFELSLGNSGQWTENVLYKFQGGGADGANPAAGLIFDDSGNLYGTTLYGFEAVGINNGVVFELSPGSGGQWKETIIYGFCALPNFCPDGSSPQAPLIFDKAGNLYGTATLGGIYEAYGVVFALTPGLPGGKWAESSLYSFQNGFPPSGLVMDAAGNLYGVAGGGTQGSGLVFEVTP